MGSCRQHDQGGDHPVRPRSELRPASPAWDHPRPEPGAAVRVHPPAAATPQHPGPVGWQEEEKPPSPRHHWIGPWECGRSAVVSTATCSNCSDQRQKEEKSPSSRDHWTGPWKCCRGTVVSAATCSHCSDERQKEEKPPSPWDHWTSAWICSGSPVVPATVGSHRPSELSKATGQILDLRDIIEYGKLCFIDVI